MSILKIILEGTQNIFHQISVKFIYLLITQILMQQQSVTFFSIQGKGMNGIDGNKK